MRKRTSDRATTNNLLTTTVLRLALASALPWETLWLVACGPSLPPRYVLEQDLASYGFRRYQKSLDIEIPVADNPATAHLGTYVESGTPMRIAPATVTRYAKEAGLSDAIRQSLRGMDTYRYGIVERAGHWMWELRGEQRDAWLAWTSGSTFVKLGVPEGESGVPEPVLEAYLERYPSNLDSKGRAERD